MKMLHAKHLFPVDIATKGQLESLGLKTLSDVQLYAIWPVDEENPVLDEEDKPTGKTLADYPGQSIKDPRTR